MNIVNRTELAKIFNCATTSIANWRNCPKHGHGKWDADEVARYIMETFSTGKIKNAAKRYISQQATSQVDDSPKQTTGNSEISSETGMLGMMSRLREMEVKVSESYQQTLNGDDFNHWMKICGELAKAEKQFDEIMLKRRSVVSIDDAAAVFFERVIPMKQQLKSLGSDTCQDLSIMDNAKEIKDYVDGKIMAIMRGAIE